MFKVQSVLSAERQEFIQFYKSNREKIKVHRSDYCFVLKKYDAEGRGQPVAALKFTKVMGDLWLLRNMLVDINFRKQGFGHRLLSDISGFVDGLNDQSRGVYCFPWLNLTSFYCQHGFEEIKVDDKKSTEGFELDSGPSFLLASEILQRYQSYRYRGLDITLCRWNKTRPAVDNIRHN